MLAASHDDTLLNAAMLQRAGELHAKRRKEEIEALGAIIGAKLAEVVGRMFRK